MSERGEDPDMSEPSGVGTERQPSTVERRYRSLLRVLPAAYRATWEEDMVATFLASMHSDDPEEAELIAELGRPGMAEVASVLALAVRLRIPGLRLELGGAGAPPRGLLYGAALRLVALVGLLVNAAAALAAFGSQLWVNGWVPLLPGPSDELRQATAPGFWQMMWVPAAVAWTLAFVALLLGYRRAAQALAVFALLAELARTVASTVDFVSGARPYLVTIWAALFVNVLIVLAMGAFHRDAPPVRRRPWLVALPVAILLVLGANYLSLHVGAWSLAVDWSAAYSLVFLVFAAGYLALPALPALPGLRGVRAAHRTLALAVLAVTVFAARSVSLLDYAAFGPAPQRLGLLAAGVLEAVAVLVAGLPLVALAARAVRGTHAPVHAGGVYG